MRILKLLTLFCWLLAGGFLANSCGSKSPDATPTPTLYDRLGKTPGITNIVNQLVANVGAETATTNSALLRTHKPMLDAVNGVNGAAPTDPERLNRLRNHFIDQIGQLSGGPVTYTGLDMVTAHKGMAISSYEFSVWRDQLQSSLNTNKVGAQEQKEVFALIDKMENDVINK